MFVPPPPGWRGAKQAAERDAGGGGGSGGGGVAAADDEFAHTCPVCLDNEDGATVGGQSCRQCYACGQTCCGACHAHISATHKCPTCRAPTNVSDLSRRRREKFKRLWKLLHNRSPGRHTLVAQSNLGVMYANGRGVEQDHEEAVIWFRTAGGRGGAEAQSDLGTMHRNGTGVKQDYEAAVEWYSKAGEQGDAGAQYNLGYMYANGEGVKQDHKEAVE